MWVDKYSSIVTSLTTYFLDISYIYNSTQVCGSVVSYPKTTQMEHIYKATKDMCQSHNHLEQYPRWTWWQKLYFNWERFEFFFPSSTMLKFWATNFKPITIRPSLNSLGWNKKSVTCSRIHFETQANRIRVNTILAKLLCLHAKPQET
jgi:hypothetical protein